MAQAKSSEKKGLHDSEPVKNVVGDYPERPYEDAVTKEQAEHLREAGVTPREVADAIEGRVSE